MNHKWSLNARLIICWHRLTIERCPEDISRQNGKMTKVRNRPPIIKTANESPVPAMRHTRPTLVDNHPVRANLEA